MKLLIEDLMASSGVKFGTSGARGLADAISDRVAYAYTMAFINHICESGRIGARQAVAIAGDLRPSTPRILSAIYQAAIDSRFEVVFAGYIASPAVAYFGIENDIPSIMVTGSHIPDDRNGIKFNRPDGEIDKLDETGIKAGQIEINDSLFNDDGSFKVPVKLPKADNSAIELYISRWSEFFGADCLAGLNLGVYQHSTVGRDDLVSIFQTLGANVTALGRAEKFIPVDTEAIRPEDVILARDWCANGEFDALISADGDCDRPLLSDEKGEWIRGDVLGVLASQYLKADGVATPVSCNTALEKCGSFENVVRTKIGSPFVIEAMEYLSAHGAQKVVGYEANGGYLQWSKIHKNNKILRPLPTRDPVIPCIAALLMAKEAGLKLSELTATLPPRYTASDRLKEFPTDLSRSILDSMNGGELLEDCQAFNLRFESLKLEAVALDATDGLRFTLKDDQVVHLRPSGNAPEFRCYTESDTADKATKLLESCLSIMSSWR